MQDLALRGSACSVLVAALFVGGVGAVLAGCSLPGDAVNGYYTPLNVLPDTDVVVETNLKTAATGADVSDQGGDTGGNVITSGPSTSASVISKDSSGTDTAYVGFNPLSHDCLGLLAIGAAGPALLGQSTPGSYYFWVKNTSSGACEAASFLTLGAPPTSWPKGDPSSTAWPGV